MAKQVLKDKVLRRVRVTHTNVRSPDRGMKGHLRAHYGETNKQFRIAYVANGFWQLEQFSPPDSALDASGDKEFGSYWLWVSRPTSFEMAKDQLRRKIAA